MPDPYTLLLDQRRSEGAARGLAKLPKDFYASTAAYLEETRRSYESDLRENPSSRKGEISRQTHQRASQLARDIVEARISKLLSAAFQASVGGAREIANALPEERALFDRLLQSLADFRRASAPYLEPGTPSAPPLVPAAVPAPAASPPESASRSAVEPNPSARLEYVRILKDSRPLQIGRDTVDLRRDDILQVPADTAQLLVTSKLAERVRPSGPNPVT